MLHVSAPVRHHQALYLYQVESRTAVKIRNTTQLPPLKFLYIFIQRLIDSH
jgi:hypothetical protein